MKKIIVLSLLTFSSLFASSELDEIQAQLKQQRIVMQKLQERVMELTKADEARKKANEKRKEDELDAKMASSKSSSSFSQNAYLPAIALILNMSTLGRNVNNPEYADYAIPGFIKSGDAELPFNPNKGFNFNYAEVAMSSTVDPYFDAFAIFHLHKDAFEIEEAYVRTRALPYGFRVKAGKFKSDFGRINSKHQHSWHFDAQPLIYKALFGPDSISDEGIQLQWVAPTDTYIMAGIEGMQGTNKQSFGDPDSNNLYVGYLKSSVDIGENLSLLGGLSIAHGKTVLKKNSNVYGVDLTARDELGAYSSVIWQSEYLYRNKDRANSTDKQAGLYSELIYNVNHNWATGARYDRITKNDTVDLSAYSVDTSNLDRYTALLQYKPFPMSRIRLEYTRDNSKIIANRRKSINEVMMTLNVATGAHGAHDY